MGIACGPVPSILAVIPGRTIATTRLIKPITTRLTAKFSTGLSTGLSTKLGTRLAKFRLATGTVALSLWTRGVMWRITGPMIGPWPVKISRLATRLVIGRLARL